MRRPSRCFSTAQLFPMEKKHAHGFFVAHFDREPLNYRYRCPFVERRDGSDR